MKIYRAIAILAGHFFDRMKSAMRSEVTFIEKMPIWNKYPRLAHYANNALPVLLLLLMADFWMPQNYPWWQKMLTKFASIVVAMIMMTGLYHSGFLCERCIRKFPTNPSEWAQKRKKQLYSYHFRIKWFYVAFWLYVAAGIIGEPLGLSRFWDNVAITITMSPQPYWFARIFKAHSELKPWCPYCKHGGRGDTSKIDSPDPSELMPA